MPLLSIVVTLIVAGVALYLVNSYIPMARRMKAILNLVVVVVVCIWLVRVAGLWGNVAGLRMSP
jgi:predicted membrane protein